MTWWLRIWLVVAVLVIAGTEAAASERRQHFAVKGEDFGLAYSVTKITQTPNDTETREIYLIEDLVSHDRLVITDRRDYLNQTREVEAVDLALKEKAVATVSFPYKSATRTETLDEMRAAKKEGTLPADLPVTIDINGVSVTSFEREWTSDKARDRRSSVRRAASNMFMERLERLRPIVGSAGEMGNVCRFLLALVLNHEACRGPVKFTPAAPDCAFDSSFRYACNDTQKRKIAEAKESGKVLAHY